MSIAVRGTTPLVVASTGNPVSGTLTGSRQPQAGDLLVFFHWNDYYALSNMPTPTVGGSSTGVTAFVGGVGDAGSPNAHTKAYWYAVTSTGDVAVSVTETGSADEEKALTIYVLSGADTIAPDRGASSGFSATSVSSLPLGSITAPDADDFLIAHLNSGGGSSAGTPYTTPGSMTEMYDTAFGGVSYVGATEQLSSAGATGTRTWTGTGNTSWSGVMVAVGAASGAAPTSADGIMPYGQFGPNFGGPVGAAVWMQDHRPAESLGGTTTVTQDLDLRWLSYVGITSSLDVRWNSYVTITQSTDLRWNSYVGLTQSVDLRWASYVGITQSVDLRWASYVGITQSLDARWAVASSISQNTDLRWAVLNTITSSTDLRWTSYAQVTQSTDLRWKVSVTVSQSIDLRWLSYVGVTQSTDLRWRSSVAVANSLDARWLSYVGITSSSDLRWAVYAAITQSSDLQWKVMGLASQSTDLRWAVISSLISINNSLDARWRVSAIVSQNSDLRWQVGSTVSNSLGAPWRVFNTVAGSTDMRWLVRNLVQASLDARWGVYVGLSTDCGLLWRVRGLAANSVDLRWICAPADLSPIPLPADARVVLGAVHTRASLEASVRAYLVTGTQAILP